MAHGRKLTLLMSSFSVPQRQSRPAASRSLGSAQKKLAYFPLHFLNSFSSSFSLLSRLYLIGGGGGVSEGGGGGGVRGVCSLFFLLIACMIAQAQIKIAVTMVNSLTSANIPYFPRILRTSADDAPCRYCGDGLDCCGLAGGAACLANPPDDPLPLDHED